MVPGYLRCPQHRIYLLIRTTINYISNDIFIKKLRTSANCLCNLCKQMVFVRNSIYILFDISQKAFKRFLQLLLPT